MEGEEAQKKTKPLTFAGKSSTQILLRSQYLNSFIHHRFDCTCISIGL